MVILGALVEKLRKATVSSCLSVGLSVRMEKICCHQADFSEIRCSRFFQKCLDKMNVLLKSVKDNGYFA